MRRTSQSPREIIALLSDERLILREREGPTSVLTRCMVWA